MRVVIQCIKKAQVVVDKELVGDTKQGLLLLVGVGPDDKQEDLGYAVRKVTNIQIFSDDMGKVSLSIQDVKESILSVPQSTLLTDTKKGNQPASTGAARPDKAEQLYNTPNGALVRCVPIETDVFGANVHISLVSDGPVTIILDTKTR